MQGKVVKVKVDYEQALCMALDYEQVQEWLNGLKEVGQVKLQGDFQQDRLEE